MARNAIRPLVKLRSTTGTGYTYITRKNRRNHPDRLVLRKYDPDHVLLLGPRGQLTTLDLGMRQAVATATIQLAAPPIAVRADGKGGGVIAYADASLTDLEGKPVAAAPADGFAAKAGTARFSHDTRVVALVGLAGDVMVRDCRTLPCADTHLVAPAGA